MAWKPMSKRAHPYFGQNKNIFTIIQNAVVAKNESWDIFVAGQRGEGKSTVALGMATQIDPLFEMDQVLFTQEDYMKYVTQPKRKGLTIFYDDIGTQKSGSSRKWQSTEAQDLADIAQVNRTDGIITIATSLERERAEKRFRFGFKVVVQPRRKLTNKETGGNGLAIDVEMRVIEFDVFTGQQFKKLWRYADGGRVKLVRVYHPSGKVWKKYSDKRHAFLASIKKTPTENREHYERDKLMVVWSKKLMGVSQKTIRNQLAVIAWMIDNGFVDEKTAIVRSEYTRMSAEICDKTQNAANGDVTKHTKLGLLVYKQTTMMKRKKQEGMIWLGELAIEMHEAFEALVDEEENSDSE